MVLKRLEEVDLDPDHPGRSLYNVFKVMSVFGERP